MHIPILSQLLSKFYFAMSPYVLLSFPKSGRTWIRFFLSEYYCAAYGRAKNLDFLPYRCLRSPGIVINHYLSSKLDRTVDTHYVNKFVGKRIIFLVRDPRDVCVSYFFQLKKRELSYEREKFKNIDFSTFLRDGHFGIEFIVSYMNRWYKALETSGVVFRVYRYEDFVSQTRHAFITLLHDVGEKTINQDAFNIALQNSTFSNMRTAEEKNSLSDERLQATDQEDVASFKTRKGIVGDFQNIATPEDKEFAESAMKKLSPVFGYTYQH